MNNLRDHEVIYCMECETAYTVYWQGNDDAGNTTYADCGQETTLQRLEYGEYKIKINLDRIFK